MKKGLADVVDVLLTAGADVKKVDQNNKRPYQLPEMTQDVAVVFARHGVLIQDMARLHPEWELYNEYVKRPLNQQRATAFYSGSKDRGSGLYDMPPEILERMMRMSVDHRYS